MVAATGLGSGLDIELLVTGLVNAERVPVSNRLIRREAEATSLISGFGQLKGALSAVDARIQALANADTFTALSASSSQSSKVGVTVTADAAVGSYGVTVEALAETQSFATSTFAAADTVIGTGSLTLTFGSPTYAGTDPDTYTAFAADGDKTPVTIDITSSNNTLEGVRDAINGADAGVTASLVKDGDSYRLLLTTDDTGLSNSLAISVSSDGDGDNTDAAGLSQLAFDATTANLSQTRAAADAEFSINGLALTAANNTVTNVLDGVTLKLNDVTESPATVTIAENRSAITSSIEGFIEAYNGYIGAANSLTNYDVTSGRSGALQGDFSARSIVSQVRAGFAAEVNGLGGSYNALSQIGITTNADGTLSLDSAALTTALDTDPASVQALFVGTDTVDGVAGRLDVVLGGILDSDGIIDSRTESLNERIAGITDQRETLDRRMSILEARYRSEFNTLDGLLAQIASTGEYLAQQLDNLPGFDNLKK